MRIAVLLVLFGWGSLPSAAWSLDAKQWFVEGNRFSSAGKFEEAEKYYLAGLKIKPNHNGINEYLGELYVQTGRIELAKERLAVLKNCNCEEYAELKEVIEKN